VTGEKIGNINYGLQNTKWIAPSGSDDDLILRVYIDSIERSLRYRNVFNRSHSIGFQSLSVREMLLKPPDASLFAQWTTDEGLKTRYDDRVSEAKAF
jgi:hypothetical protein